MKKITYYHYPHPYNVGDNLTPYILQHFRPDVELERVKEGAEGKTILVGSIMRVILPGDTIVGAGVMRKTDEFPQAPECRFLAVRGKLSRAVLQKYGATVPEVYGDPAILMPLIYRPEIKKTHEVGIIPHYIDAAMCGPAMQKSLAAGRTYKMIDICQDYVSFVNELLSVETVISSSLHGLILAEAYGLSAEWVVLSSKVLGNGFKFRDYLTGTGRAPIEQGKFPKLSEKKLAQMQRDLIKAIKKI